MSKQKSNDIVLPGTILGVAEEFFPGDNVVESNGYLISTAIGRVRIDAARRVIRVDAFKKLYYPQLGSMVYAIVTSVREDIALLRIIGSRLDNYVSGNQYAGAIHISQSGLGRDIRSLYSVLRFGDIVYAKVISKSNPFILSLKHASAGVVLSFCPRCTNHLAKKKDRLVCTRCGYTESRKVSPKYIYQI